MGQRDAFLASDVEEARPALSQVAAATVHQARTPVLEQLQLQAPSADPSLLGVVESASLEKVDQATASDQDLLATALELEGKGPCQTSSDQMIITQAEKMLSSGGCHVGDSDVECISIKSGSRSRSSSPREHRP